MKGDVLFVRSQESIDLPDRDWHLRWSELITGELQTVSVPGTHATLMLTDDNTSVMADHINDAIAAVEDNN